MQALSCQHLRFAVLAYGCVSLLDAVRPAHSPKFDLAPTQTLPMPSRSRELHRCTNRAATRTMQDVRPMRTYARRFGALPFRGTFCVGYRGFASDAGWGACDMRRLSTRRCSDRAPNCDNTLHCGRAHCSSSHHEEGHARQKEHRDKSKVAERRDARAGEAGEVNTEEEILPSDDDYTCAHMCEEEDQDATYSDEDEDREEDEDEEEEEFFLPDPVDITVHDGWMTADDKMRARYARRLRKADRQLRFFELLSPAHIHQYIHISEVCTPHGVRWMDVYARPHLWQNTRRTRFSEGQFTRAALNVLFEKSPLKDVHIRFMDSGTLPIMLHGSDCACLLLRHAHDRAAQSGVARANPHRSHIDDVRANPTSPMSPQTLTGQSPSTSWAHGRWDRSSRTDRAAARLDNDPTAYYYDEDSNSFIPVLPAQEERKEDVHSVYGSGREGGHARWSRHLTWQAVRVTPMLARFVRGWNKVWRRGGGDPVSGQHDGRASRGAKTAAANSRTTEHHSSCAHASTQTRQEENRTKIAAGDLTQLLTVFIVRERHKSHGTNTASDGSSVTANDKSNRDTDRVSTAANQDLNKSTDEDERIDRTTREDDGREGYRCTVVTVHPSPLAFVQHVHTHWSDFVAQDAAVSQRECEAETVHSNREGGRRTCAREAGDDEDVELDVRNDRALAGSGYFSVLTTGVEHWLPFHRTVQEWDDVVRVVVHGTLRGLQDAVYQNTFSLDALEVAIFDDASTAASVAQLKQRTQLMARLHVLTRRARLYSSVLREMRVAYVKMKKTMQSPITAMDRKELLNLQSTASLAVQLEDHSHSLLALQFSIAMNHLERHLRTLTIFSTIFIPLEFIASCFSTNFPDILEMEDSNLAVIVATIMLTVAAIVTSRWIKQRDR